MLYLLFAHRDSAAYFVVVEHNIKIDECSDLILILTLTVIVSFLPLVMDYYMEQYLGLFDVPYDLVIPPTRIGQVGVANVGFQAHQRYCDARTEPSRDLISRSG
jgi:hypothetical protein